MLRILLRLSKVKKMIGMVSDEEVVKYAKVLKDFCSNIMQECDDCPFFLDTHKLYWEDKCVLGVPVRWNIEKVRADD